MVTGESILNQWLDKYQIVLNQNYRDKGIKASGAFERGERRESSVSRVALYAPYHAYHMIQGRRGNADQSPDALRRWVGWAGSTFMADWVKAKGINISPYAVAWKVARRGFTAPANGTLLTDTFTPEAYNELYSGLLELYVKDFKTSIQKTWQV